MDRFGDRIKRGIKMKGGAKNVLYLSLTSFINDTSSKIILPILPLFIKEIGGGGLAIGIISGFGEGIASLFKMVAGYWSDKIGKRKPFVIAGYLASSIAKLSFALSKAWYDVLFLRSLERFGKGLRSAPRDAIIAASSEKKRRGMYFGIHRAMDSGGAVLGSIIALVLVLLFKLSFREIFLIAGILAFLSILPLLVVKESSSKGKQRSSLKIELTNLPKPLKTFIIISTLFALGNFSYMFFVLKAKIYFTGILATAVPIILYTLYQTTYTIFAVPAGILSDKIGRKCVLLAGYGLFGLVCVGFILFHSLQFFILLFLMLGLNYALVNANERAFVSDLSKEETRGTALGTYHMLNSMALFPGGIIAGLIWDINPACTFIYGALISLIVVCAFLYLLRD